MDRKMKERLRKIPREDLEEISYLINEHFKSHGLTLKDIQQITSTVPQGSNSEKINLVVKA